MARRIGDTHEVQQTTKSDARPPAVPYASRGAGLYSEVRCDRTDSLRARAADQAGGPTAFPT